MTSTMTSTCVMQNAHGIGILYYGIGCDMIHWYVNTCMYHKRYVKGMSMWFVHAWKPYNHSSLHERCHDDGIVYGKTCKGREGGGNGKREGGRGEGGIKEERKRYERQMRRQILCSAPITT